jgi:hypothetical protein
MADRQLTINTNPIRNGSKNRPRGDRRQMIRAAAAAVPEEYFGPERKWLAQRGPDIARLAQQVKMVTAIVNAEKQFYDVSGNCNPVLTPVAQYLNGIAEGDDTQGRAGRSIRAKELTVRAHFYSSTAATTSSVIRFFIVKDNDPRGSVPSVGTLFQSGTASVDGLPVLDTQQGRYKWLYDETFLLGIVGGGNDSKIITLDMKLDHHINFIGTAAATASAGQGTLWLFVLADITATNSSTGQFYSRLRYYDN